MNISLCLLNFESKRRSCARLWDAVSGTRSVSPDWSLMRKTRLVQASSQISAGLAEISDIAVIIATETRCGGPGHRCGPDWSL